jgi:hypothetical protein
MNVLLTSNDNDDFDIIHEKFKELCNGNFSNKKVISEEILSKQFADGHIHTAYVQGAVPSTRRFKGCTIYSTGIRGIYVIAKD